MDRDEMTREQWVDALAERGRTPGGEASRTALEAMGLKNGHQPQYTPAYEVIAAGIDGFDWQIREETRPGRMDGPQTVVVFQKYPTVGGCLPSLADLVRHAKGEIVLTFDQFRPRIQKAVQPLFDLGPVGVAFAHLLVKQSLSLPPRPIMEAVAKWLAKAMAGAESTVYSAVCPDYSVEYGRYTFDSLGDGIGLVAARILGILPTFAQFCKEHGLPVTFVVAMGDIEATPKNCDRVGLTKDEFVEKLRGSARAFAAACPEDMRLEVPLTTEVGNWDAALAHAKQQAQQGRFTGIYPFSDKDWEQTIKARLPLYKRWYGENVDGDATLRDQVPEYMALGDNAFNSYPNCLALGGDAPMMAIFWQGTDTKRLRPVLYLPRQDY